MAEEKLTNQKNKSKSQGPLLGAEIKPTMAADSTKIDIDVKKDFIDDILMAASVSKLDIAALEEFTQISNSRDRIYQQIDTMAQDSKVSSIIRVYAEDVCETSDNGHIIWCESTDPKISKFVNYLLNVMNADKNIFKWVCCLIKYGDVYLKLYRESDYTDQLFKPDNIAKAFSARTALKEDIQKTDESVRLNVRAENDPYSYYVEMVPDPSTMFELTKYGKTFGYIETPNEDGQLNFLNYTSVNETQTAFNNFKMKSNDVNIYQADDYVHACLDEGITRFPETVDLFISDDDYRHETNAQSYTVRRGKSLLYDAYKIWREQSLLEGATLLNRVTKSSLFRLVGVEVGDMPKEQSQATLRRVKEMIEQKTSYMTGEGMSEYNNPGPIENNIYYTTHEGKGNISVEAIGGDVDVKNLADLDWWNTKFYSSFGIPKAFFGWTEDSAGFNGGTSLSIISSIYSKGVKRVQNAIIQALTDAINLILLNKGCSSYLNNFVLKMKAPITQEELDYRANLTDRVSAISSIQSLFADIENKPRRLEILKTLVRTLNYGEDLVAEIDGEIEEAIKKEEQSANEGDANEGEKSTEMENKDLGDFDLPAVESFTKSTGTSLHEDQDLIIKESDDLPTPAELGLDMTVNN